MEHPVTLPEEMCSELLRSGKTFYEMLTEAARWGADQELKGVCEYIGCDGNWFADPSHRLNELRTARRPKPPSLAEQGLETLNWIESESPWDKAMFDPLRSALERLRELEGNG